MRSYSLEIEPGGKAIIKPGTILMSMHAIRLLIFGAGAVLLTISYLYLPGKLLLHLLLAFFAIWVTFSQIGCRAEISCDKTGKEWTIARPRVFYGFLLTGHDKITVKEKLKELRCGHAIGGVVPLPYDLVIPILIFDSGRKIRAWEKTMATDFMGISREEFRTMAEHFQVKSHWYE
ncbi:MAG: hypothetical protein HY544_01705 [Candidatus Diapherotrites archaeon]|uniref:Uncharacterized protein n=1 Tax=Candidatus Iainarchaeum sp. TaxID=3101447 RepID=A0A8T3YIW7_9ARCH|nr:hypothetical protein [Candidatus Diapherotrites archaeon]